MKKHSWVQEFPISITITDQAGKIVEMNAKAAQTFEKDGGLKLIGQNVMSCHPEKAQVKLRDIRDNQKTNVYTIEKAGVKKLVYQAPWYQDGEYAGVAELAIDIPFEMPHFVRD